MIRLFRVSMPSSAIALIISETILVFSCYILAGYVTLDLASDIFLWEEGGCWRGCSHLLGEWYIRAPYAPLRERRRCCFWVPRGRCGKSCTVCRNVRSWGWGPSVSWTSRFGPSRSRVCLAWA